MNLLPLGKKYKLLYRSSRDGLTGKAFHERCNYQGPTITIVKPGETNGRVFGGYTSANWITTSSF